MKNETENEDKLDMIARLVVNSLEEIKTEIKRVDLKFENKITELQTEMHTGFANLRLEIRDLSRQAEALERKLSGLRESIDNASTKSEYKELRDKVLAMEVHFA